jgi:hypothetical protein
VPSVGGMFHLRSVGEPVSDYLCGGDLMKHVLIILVVLGAFTAGTVCLFFTRQVQEGDIRSAETRIRGQIPWVRRYARSREHLINTRLTGVIFYIIGIGIVAALLNNGRLPVKW